jgi:hypothetical protein
MIPKEVRAWIETSLARLQRIVTLLEQIKQLLEDRDGLRRENDTDNWSH